MRSFRGAFGRLRMSFRNFSGSWWLAGLSLAPSIGSGSMDESSVVFLVARSAVRVVFCSVVRCGLLVSGRLFLEFGRGFLFRPLTSAIC